jgi:hypothetical protein
MAESGAQSLRIPTDVRLTEYRCVIGVRASVNEPISHAKLIPKDR